MGRADHSAIILRHVSTSTASFTVYDEMLIYGGYKKTASVDTVYDDVWRGVRDFSDNTFRWTKVTITSGAPGPRTGHTMCSMTRTASTDTSYFMWGGTSGLGVAPTDNKLWKLRFTAYATAVWETVAVGGSTRPSPRSEHTLVYDPNLPGTSACGNAATRSLVLFGGSTASGLSNELWRLWWPSGNSPVWERDDTTAGVPSARAGHSASLDPGTQQLIIFGGTTADSLGDSLVYVSRLTGRGCSAPGWRTMAGHHNRLTNHIGVVGTAQNAGVYARISEIYDPVGEEWTPVSAPLLQPWFPFMHLTKNGKVFYSGPSKESFFLTLGGSPSWSKFPTTTASGAIEGGTAVMYRPNKVMKTGSSFNGSSKVAHGKTRYINLDSDTQWQESEDMIGRYNHNLVILPTGQVLVTGGTDSTNNNATQGRRLPQIWDPDSGSTGKWYGNVEGDTLRHDIYLRDYHSTAALLPDGRILSAGGNADPGSYTMVNVYCPPYLFTSTGASAVRPSITSIPQRIRYGRNVLIHSPSGTSAKRQCLLRPASTTHSYDQNQRYVPLTVVDTVAGGSQLLVTAPADSFIAPPGDYLLFLLNVSGVPSVGQWVRVGSVWDVGDVTKPDTNALHVETVAPNSVTLTWSSPGDDSLTGQAWQYEVRRSASSMNQGNAGSGTLVTPDVVPAVVGTTQSTQVTGLSHHTNYWFGLRTADESGNLSAWSIIGPITTLSGGGCGECEARAGNASDRTEDTDEGATERRQSGLAAAGTGGVAADPASIVMVAEFAKTDSTVTWVLCKAARNAVQGLESRYSTGIVLQSQLGGSWVTRGWIPSNGEVGICGLAESGRMIWVDPDSVGEVPTNPDGFELLSATTSSDGPLAIGESDTTVMVDGLVEGDSTTLTYRPAEGEGKKFFLLLSARGEGASANARQVTSRQMVFALQQNRPNPFGAAAQFAFTLPQQLPVSLDVYDLQGRRVKNLVNRPLPAGEHVVGWDRRNQSGDHVQAGIYFYRIRAGQYVQERKLVVLP